MKKTIITISREFGSGGRTIGHQVAEQLGYPYYDKELIKTVAEKTGFDPNYVEEYGEYSPGKSLLSDLLAGERQNECFHYCRTCESFHFGRYRAHA